MKKTFILFMLFIFSASYSHAAPVPEIFVQTGHSGSVMFVTINPGNSYMVTVERSTDRYNKYYIKTWDFASGREIRTLEFISFEGIKNIYFLTEDTFIVFDDKLAEIFDVYGQKLEKIILPKVKAVFCPVISKDRQYYFPGNEETKIYSMKDGAEIFLPKSRKHEGYWVYHEDAKNLGYGYYGVFRTKPSAEGNVEYVIYDDSLNVQRKGILKTKDMRKGWHVFKISPDLKYLADMDYGDLEDCKISVYNLETGQKILSYKARALAKAVSPVPRDEQLDIGFLPDNRLRVAYCKLKSNRWNAARLSSQVEMILITPVKNEIYSEKKLVLDDLDDQAPYLITDKGMLIVGYENGNVKMLDIHTGAEMKSFGAKPSVFEYSACVGNQIINYQDDWTSTVTNHFNLWDMGNASLKKFNVTTETSVTKHPVSHIRYSSDPDSLYSKIPKEFWKDDYKKSSFYGRQSTDMTFSCMKDSGDFSAKPENHKLILTNRMTKKKMADLYAFTDGEWIIITPDGYFNASTNGAKYINVRLDNKVYSIDQFYAKFYRPELVHLAIAGKDLQKGETLGDILAKSPAPVVQITSPISGSSVDKDNIVVSLRIIDSGGGIGNVMLYLNGTQVANETRGVIIKGKTSTNEKTMSFTIPLMEGRNEIRVIAFNKENSMESNPALLSIFSKTVMQKPNLYALVIGINEYKNKSISLKYAVSDAKIFAETLKKTGAPLFAKMNIQLFTTPAETTRENIIKAFEGLRLQIKPNDLFVFYNASHGIVDVVDDEEQYFLLTSNVLLLSSRHIGKDAMSQKELAKLIGNIPAQKKFVILDTCNAGKGGREIQVALLQQTRGLTDSTAVKLLQRAVGSAVFSASSDTQLALEGYKGHGLFTFVLIEGLKGKADIKKDGYITVLGLADYVEENVVKLSEEVFKRQQTPTIQTGANFPVGMVRIQ